MLKLNKKMMESAVSALKEHKASALLLFVDAIEEKFVFTIRTNFSICNN